MPEVREVTESDREWLRDALLEHWGSTRVARRGELVEATPLPGYVSEVRGEPVGFATYAVRGDECEVVTLNAFTEGRGVGTSLLRAVRDEARRRGCRRLWLVTTNDNVRALRFYQRRGLRLAALRPGAIDDVRRRLKPGISEIGYDGIPIRDELELETEP